MGAWATHADNRIGKVQRRPLTAGKQDLEPGARAPSKGKQLPLSPLTLTLKSMLQPPEVISVIHISDQEIFENQV